MGRFRVGKKSPLRGLVCCVMAVALFTVPVSAAGSLRVAGVAQESGSPGISCKILYPQISGIDNKNTQQKMNVAFMEMAKGIRTEAEYEAKSGTVSAKMDFRVTRNQSGIMSLVVKESLKKGENEKCAQHGLTVDTVTGRRYLLSDLFIDNADYVATLSSRVNAQIKSSRLQQKMVKEFKSISENADFYLTADSLVLFLRQGEYFSDDCAVKEFAIPLGSIDEIMKPQFLLK